LRRQGPGISSEIEIQYLVGACRCHGRRQGPGISSEIEIMSTFTNYVHTYDVARGLASRLRLKYNALFWCHDALLRRQGPGFSSEIEIPQRPDHSSQGEPVARGLASRLRLK